MKIKCKGHVQLIVKNSKTGEIKQTIEQDNLFLNIGRQKLLYRCGSSGCYCRIIISDSESVESATATSIPATVLWGSDTGLTSSNEINGLSVTRRWNVTIPEPVSPRNINTVGLANDAVGTNAMCYTKLTSTVVQGIEDTVVVYYSLTLSTY